PPRTWDHFAAYLRLPRPLAWHWWQALSKARWSETVELRQSFLLHASVPLDTHAHVHQTACPRRLATVLHHLEQEGLLTPTEGNTILEYVLLCTDREGGWRQRGEGERP